MWHESEKGKSSTYRELKAPLSALKSSFSLIEGKKVKIFTDNQNVVRIVHGGSSIVELQEMAFGDF